MDDVTAPENEGIFVMVSDFDAFYDGVHAQAFRVREREICCDGGFLTGNPENCYHLSRLRVKYYGLLRDGSTAAENLAKEIED